VKTIVPLLLGLLLLCGCARRYVITVTNGTQMTTLGKPRLENGAYYFKDIQGVDSHIPATRVREIAPASMVGEKSSQFNPSSK
jgi:hypothetical protein